MSQVLDGDEGERTPATTEAESQAGGYYGETLSLIARGRRLGGASKPEPPQEG